MIAQLSSPFPDHTFAVNRARDGDPTAFAELVERYKNAVSAVALAAVHDVALSEDVAQNAFVEAWRGLRKLRQPTSFGPWLLQLTRRQALQALRGGKRRLKRDGVWHSLQPTAVPDAEAMVHARERQRDLRVALEQLPDDTRELLVLYYREEQSIEQVATLLELSAATARKRLERARHALKDRLDAVAEIVAKTAPAAAFVALVMASVDAHATGALGAAAENVGVTAAARSRGLLPRSLLAKLSAAVALASISWWTATHLFHPAEPKYADRSTQELVAPLARFSTRSDPPSSGESASSISHQKESIDGRVVDASGSPLAARIVIKRHEDNDVVAGTAGEDGTFHVGALKEGTYDVIAEAGPRRGSIDNVVLSRGGSYFAELQLYDLVKPLVGRVVDDLGSPLGGRSVAFRSPHAAMLVLLGQARHVDQTGMFAWSDIAPGTHTVEVQVLGKTVASRQVTIKANEDLDLGEILLAK